MKLRMGSCGQASTVHKCFAVGLGDEAGERLDPVGLGEEEAVELGDALVRWLRELGYAALTEGAGYCGRSGCTCTVAQPLTVAPVAAPALW